MKTLAEIEAAVRALPASERQQLLLRLGKTPLPKTRRGLKSAAWPPIEGLPADLSTNTRDKVRALVQARHAANR